MHIVKFKKWNCELQFGKYYNGRTAIELIEVGTGDPVAVATVNILEIGELENDEVVIKDYSENSGMLKTLVKHKIVSDPIATHKRDWVTFYVCKLLVKPE